MTYLEHLLLDHRHARVLLDLLAEQVDHVRGVRARPDFDVMADILLYLRRFGDAVHHPRERPLFERLSELDPQWVRPTAGFGQEHVDLANQSSGVARCIDGVRSEAFVSRDELCVAADRYITLYRSHMQEEERAFAAARSILCAADWQWVEASFEVSDDPLFGAVVADDLSNLRRLVHERYPSGFGGD